jgi:hypothetical protein
MSQSDQKLKDKAKEDKKLEDAVLNEENRRKAKHIVDREEQGKAPELIIRRASEIKIERLERSLVGDLSLGP